MKGVSFAKLFHT